MTLAVAVQHQRAVLPALGRYELALAASELDVYEAQRLRYRTQISAVASGNTWKAEHLRNA